MLDSDPLDPRQNDLALKLFAAEAIILDYLKVPPQINPLGRRRAMATGPDLDAWPPTPPAPVTPPRGPIPEDDPIVQAAILLELGELWRFRGDDTNDSERRSESLEVGQLSPTITNLLRRYRDPAYA